MKAKKLNGHAHIPYKPRYKLNSATGKYELDIENLFIRWYKPIRQWLSHTSEFRSMDLDDLAQEVFLRIILYKVGEKVIPNMQGYIFRIARNIANEKQERVVHRKPHIEIQDREVQFFTQLIEFLDPEFVADRASQTQALKHALQALPQRQKTAVRLHFVHGLTYKQIGEKMDTTYRTVLRDLTHAYDKLRTVVKRSDFQIGG